MAWLEIPVVGDYPQQSSQVTLDGVTYTFQYRWNERGSSWFLYLYDEEEQEPLAVARLVPGFPLLWRTLAGMVQVEAPDGLKGDQGDLTRMRILYADASEFA